MERMSVVTHVIPQSFSDGQLLNIVTPTIAQPQELLVAQAGDPGQVIPMTLTTAIAPIHLEQKLDASLEREKQAIYKHPLFPLMALMFERCEQASASPDFPCENFDTDIQAFILHQEKERKSFYSNDPDLDTLMIKSIQVLRIHLLELEKVTELCKDFCTRYTNCLKGKLQSENLLRTESDYDQSMFDEPPKESSQSVQNIVTTVAGGVILQQPFQSSVPAMQTLGPGQIMSGGTVYQMVQTPQGLVAQPIQIQSTLPSLSTPVIHGGTPLSQIGVASTHSLVSTSSSNTVVNTIGSMNYDSDDDDGGKKKNKRGVLPKSATQVMKSWLFQHIVHPYPTEDEKRQIATQTNLTLLQVNNWFINARRRILQPMLDAGNPDQAKAKKAKPQSKPPQRFWPFGGVPDKSTTTSVSKQDSITSSPPSTTNVTTMGQTIVLPPGSFVMPDGQIMNLQGAANMAAMLNQVKQTSLSPSSDKDFSDNNNNSHNTDNDDLGDSEDMT